MNAERLTETADMLRENMNASMKWFQEATSELTETQKKHADFTNNVFNKMVDDAINLSKNNLNITWGISERMLEGFQKNYNDLLAVSRSTLRRFAETPGGKLPGLQGEFTSWFADTSLRQLEMAEEFNQKYFENAYNQLNFSKSYFTPLIEKSSKELKDNFKSNGNPYSQFYDTFNKLFQHYFGSSKEMMNEFNSRANGIAQSNMKLWSDFFTRGSNGSVKETGHAPAKKGHTENEKKIKESVL